MEEHATPDEANFVRQMNRIKDQNDQIRDQMLTSLRSLPADEPPRITDNVRHDTTILELQDKIKHLTGLSTVKDRKYAELEGKI